MYMESSHPDWLHYLEIPRQASTPVKLDRILEERMESFMKGRSVRPFADAGTNADR